MDMDNHFNCVAIPINEGKIRNMTFDGCHYYFVLDEEIVKTDLQFKIIYKYKVKRRYNYICYDWEQKCFWASSQHCDFIYKLDCKMKEIAEVSIDEINRNFGEVTGLSYDCCCNKLVISLERAIFKTDSKGDFEKCVCISDAKITGILSLCPGYLISVLKGRKRCVYLWSPKGCFKEIFCLQHGGEIRNMIFNPCHDHDIYIEFFVYYGERKPYLCRMNIDELNMGFELSHCNYKICNRCCKGHNPDPEPTNCNGILESIALEEAALSHILNAEGEKIQKILAITDDFDKIMCVNKEVNDTIINVTMLEQTLYAKLIAVSKICPFDDETHCCNKNKPLDD